MRRRIVVLATLAMALVLPACGSSEETAEDALRAALDQTARMSRTIAYQETATGRDVAVHVVLADDYTFDARVRIDGEQALHEIVVDDALAVRVTSPSALDTLFPLSEEATEEDLAARAALASGTWALDDVGAPDTVVLSAQERVVGHDPVLDALTQLAYVERAIDEAADVQRFNEESLEYNAREDIFPKPDKGSDVVRYDLVPPKIVASSSAISQDTLPDAAHFRRMSVYVERGLVVKVLESVDMGFRLDRVRRLFDFPVKDGDDAASSVLAALNAQRVEQGSEPIRMRTMSLEVAPLDAETELALPSDAVAARLAMVHRPTSASASTSGSASGSAADAP